MKTAHKQAKKQRQTVQRETALATQQLAELRARFDQRLASLSTPQSKEALNAFMDEPVLLEEKVLAGASY